MQRVRLVMVTVLAVAQITGCVDAQVKAGNNPATPAEQPIWQFGSASHLLWSTSQGSLN